MAFRDLDEFLEAEPLVLPIRGKDYSFPAEISARTWLRVQRLGPELNRAVAASQAGEPFDADAEALSDIDSDELLTELCGDALEEMLDDGVTSAQLKVVLATLLVFHLSDRDQAEAIWNARGETPAPNRAARRSSTPATPSRSRGSRAGSTSRSNQAARRGRPSSSSGS
jgi:hypothetical protein